MAKYDLIIAGAGIAGLIAARTAAQDGLKVLVVETRKNIGEINRACSAIIRMQPGGFMTEKKPTDRVINPVKITLEMDFDRNWFHFGQLGFSIEYTGPVRVYHNKVAMSPSGYNVWMEPDNSKLFAIQIDKEVLIRDMLEAAVKAGAEFRTEVRALHVRNTTTGVILEAQAGTGHEELEASKVLAADGVMSRLVDNLGLNAKRRSMGESKVLLYILKGVETPYPESTIFNISMPALNRHIFFTLALWPDSQHQLHVAGAPEANLPAILDSFMKHPNFVAWFHRAKVVRKMGCSRILRTPIPEPVVGNIYIAGDASSFVECSLKGASGAGFKVAKCILKELKDEDGKSDYVDWWQHSFNFNSPQYLAMGRVIPRPVAVLSDNEVDELHRFLAGRHGHINDIVSDMRDILLREKPAIYHKLFPTVSGPPQPGRPEPNAARHQG